MNKVEEILNKIGITQQESRAYLTLLGLNEAQTGLLCKEAKIASSNIYKILENLMEKGLVSYRVQNNIKVFMPAPPETLNELFLEKQKSLDEERIEISDLISNLKKREPTEQPYSNYKYYEGLIGIKSMWHEINTTMNKNMVLKIHTAKKESYEKLIGFYTEHHKIRKKKKVKELMIFPKEDYDLAKKRMDKFTKIKFTDLKNDAEWGIAGDILYIQYLIGAKPRGFLIKDKLFAKTFEFAFDTLWNVAKN
jgi:HTH-type transcriptional regulator, sugar sensing transcriptional regulator